MSRGLLAAMAFVLVGVTALAGMPAGAALVPAAHYTPVAGDSFDYSETVFLTGGIGPNYYGYSEHSHYNGSISITAVLPNGTETADYAASGNYTNSTSGSEPWSESGSFTFSAVTFHYVQGTDNQTGYTNPFVWFFMDNSLGNGSTFYILNTRMTVVSTDATFADPISSTGYVRAIHAEGSGAYTRSDAYGNFNATYTWDAYFDPGTGYALGYRYSELDRNGQGDGFSWNDNLTDTRASFPVTEAAAPASPAAPIPWTIVGIVLVVVVIVVVLVALLLRRRRTRGGLGRTPLPRHSQATVLPNPPGFGPPPPINLTPRDQPIPQVVLRETVKVPCRFCGTLIDSTDLNCPKCGAPRT